jgi:predicted DNA-binding transcriptional regulator AlpA
MSKPRRDIECPRDPVGLSMEEAAAYLGISSSLFDRAVQIGAMPAPYELFGRIIWDAEEVHAALRRLPKRGGKEQDYGSKPSPYRDFAA